MDRWLNKVAVVTGASAGIGKAIVEKLVNSKLIVVGLARRPERIEEIRSKLPKNLQKNLHIRKCDVSVEKEVLDTFKWIEKELGGIDILINNAGVLRTTELVELNNTKLIDETFHTNVMGCVYCVREAFNSMKSRNVAGHVIVINSIAGHKVPYFGNTLPSMNIYPATKHAITAMVETYRQEFAKHDTKIKITSISPGAVDTEIFPTNLEAIIKATMPLLKSEDIADAVVYILGTPPNVQVHELTIKPLGEQF